jgi:hypothetical protein
MIVPMETLNFHIFWERKKGQRIEIPLPLAVPHCAQIVPVKVKYLQIKSNETKSAVENCQRINMLKINVFSNPNSVGSKSREGNFMQVRFRPPAP